MLSRNFFLASVFSRTVKNCAETSGNYSAQLTGWAVKLSNRSPQIWATNSDAILLLTHRQVFPFNSIIMYMRTKYTRLLQKLWAQNCANIVPMPATSFWLQSGPMAQYLNKYDIRMYRNFPRGTRYDIIIWYCNIFKLVYTVIVYVYNIHGMQKSITKAVLLNNVSIFIWNCLVNSNV